MAKTRLDLHNELCEVLGSENCYFSPPSMLIKYPCILYTRENPEISFADNERYIKRNQWTITIIDHDPDSKIPETFEEHFKRYFSKSREYPRDGLYHFVYTLYY